MTDVEEAKKDLDFVSFHKSTKRKKCSQKIDVEVEKAIDDLQSLLCGVCSQPFSESNELTYHHMKHSILELAHALTDAQVGKIDLEIGARYSDSANSFNCDEDKSDELKLEVTESNDDLNDIPEASILKDPIEENKQTKISRKNGGSRAPQTCDICHKVLSSRSTLVKHMVIHQKDKPFKCDQCDSSFNQKRDLNTHVMQKHTSERPHTCDICHKGFVHKFYLIEHMTYHTGERHYQCTQCGKRFQAQSALTKHSKRHTTTRKFTCNICPKAFTVKSDLKAHFKFVHDKPASSKGIPTQPLKNLHNLDFDVNYENEFNASKKVGDVRKWQKDAWYAKEFKVEEEDWDDSKKEEMKNGDHGLSDLDRQRILESQQIEEWMISQGVQLGPVADSDDVIIPKHDVIIPKTVTIDDQIPPLGSVNPINPPSIQVAAYIPNVPKL